MKRINYFLIGLLVVIFSCSKTPERQEQLFELQIYMLSGSNAAEAPSMPLYPGETSIHIVEKMMADEGGIERQLKKTFGYAAVKLNSICSFPFYKSDDQQKFSVKISAEYKLNLILFPNDAADVLPFSLNLLNTSGHQRDTTASQNSLISLRADVPIKKGLILGRALSGTEQKSLFLVLQPARKSVNSADDFIRQLSQYSDLVKIYSEIALKKFSERAIHLYGDANKIKTYFQKIIDLKNTVNPDSVVPFAELSKKPKLFKSDPIKYPESARKAQLQGVTLISLLISPEGDVLRSEMIRSSGSAALDSSAMTAVNKFKFEPGELDGRPVRVKLTIPITFKLKK